MFKKYSWIFVAICGVVMMGPLSGQDLFVSQFRYAPMMVNPAQTGDYYGTLRLGGTYRDQGFSVTKSSYTTPSFYVDAPLFDGIWDGDWIGLGGYIIQDRSGAGQLTTGEFRFSGAYHLSLSEDNFRYFTLGIQGGTYQRRFRRPMNLQFGDGLRDGTQSQDAGRAVTDGRPRWSFAIGGMFRAKQENGNEIRVGASADRFFQHNYSIEQRGGGMDPMDPDPPQGGGSSALTRIPLRFTGHASVDLSLGGGYVLTPQAIYQIMGNFGETTIQSILRIPVNEEKDFSLLTGVGYRFGDAAQIMIGARYKLIEASLGYDMTVSDLAQANNRTGAVELGVSYIIRIEKDPEVTRRIFCPRF